MDLATIEMPKEQAEAKFKEYRNALRKRHDVEDERMMRGYKVLARGHRVIELSKTLRAGGIQVVSGRTWNGSSAFVLPKLAVGWADQSYVYATGVTREGGMTYWWNEGLNPQATARNIRMPSSTFDVTGIEDFPSAGWRETFHAMLPTVPPALRPAHKLRGYLILWEAEWKQKRPPAPRDPALLKRIGGDLYAVVAVWELTDLERAVLSGRR